MNQEVVWTFAAEDEQVGGQFDSREVSRRLAVNLIEDWTNLKDRGTQLVIRSRLPNGRKRRPVAFRLDPASGQVTPLRIRLSISHLSKVAAVVASDRRVGIDIVDTRLQLNSNFKDIWFDPRERRLIGSREIHGFWAAKEATYKALCRRESFRPNHWKIASIEERFNPNAAVSLQIGVSSFSKNGFQEVADPVGKRSSLSRRRHAEVTLLSVSHHLIAIAVVCPNARIVYSDGALTESSFQPCNFSPTLKVST